MNTTTKNLLEGGVTLVAGLALWLFGDRVDLPVISLVKIGVVASCLGVVQLGYAGYLSLGRAHRPKG
ncbi:DUF5708 family protein [Streptomyces palmae]|uniref:Uncharacterized protein n=1 Tax=Streptomyces palmae TaxID=1701085 RepID=A0A4Z0GGK2_9ACTN|nr:DUF5708 family protein [Streptomyces palmae]TGA95263.1 hypothetical protein E4099_25715 [Streptomyces palmae]